MKLAPSGTFIVVLIRDYPNNNYSHFFFNQIVINKIEITLCCTINIIWAQHMHNRNSNINKR